MRWGAFISLCILCGLYAVTAQEESRIQFSLEPQQTGGFHLVATKNDSREVLGHIGRGVATGALAYVNIESEVLVQTGSTFFNLSVNQEDDKTWLRVTWDANTTVRLEDCFDFGTKQWYGGPEQFYQMWPIQNANLTESPQVSKEQDNGAIDERYWVNSAGQYIYVHPEVPLFVDYHNLVDNHICFISEVATPFSTRRTHNPLVYDIWFHNNAKEAHQHAVKTYLGKPSESPDHRMIQYPIWSTWAKYSRDINESSVLEFASQIVDNGFQNAQIEIDDLWEICYGSLTVDETKFPDFKGLVQILKGWGFRVTIWIHPFINKNCDPWYSEALNNGYLVLAEDGSPDTYWWNANGSMGSYVDFTNPEAAAWWSGRVRNLLDTYDIDSLKFDAGESSFSPQIPVQSGDIDLHPGHIVSSYVKTCAEFGPMIEVRAGFGTQHLPVFVRMVDRDSIWGLNNGLQTTVTTLLQMNLNGYTLVLPDMIGGNGMNLNADVLPDKELFVRWVQANVFMPAMQYSFVPWEFDNETIEICRRYTELHASYADEIAAAIQASVDHGTPVNAPIWWIDPADEEALAIWDEFLLGETILSAPVLHEGATSRDIYLPKGTWLEKGDPESVYEGPQWIYNYSAPLDTLPFFVLKTEIQEVSGALALQSYALAVATALIVRFFL